MYMYVCTGIDMILHQSTQINCKAILLCCTCDLPAKAEVLSLMDSRDVLGVHKKVCMATDST